MPILSYTELNDNLIQIQTPVLNYSEFIFDYFENLYNTGCRPEELLHVSRWTNPSIGVYELQPLKGNMPRIFNQSELTDEFKTAIGVNRNLYMTTSIRKFDYYFKKWFLVPNVSKGSKPSLLYLFRYRYIKGLNLSGYTNAQIATKMGYTNVAMAVIYINAVLEY